MQKFRSAKKISLILTLVMLAGTIFSPFVPAVNTVSASSTATATCSSSVDVEAGQEVTWTGTISGSAGDYTYEWSGTDNLVGTDEIVVFSYEEAGTKTANLEVSVTTDDPNVSVECTVDYDLGEVPEQNEKPVITLLGDNPMEIVLNGAFSDPGATANDPEDGDITDDIIVSGSVDTSTLGNYELDYDVEDSEGLAADTVTRTVNVVPTGGPKDTTATCSLTESFEITTTDPVEISATVVGSPEPLTYSWSGDDGLSGNTSTIIHSYSSTGLKSITIDVETSTGSNPSISCDAIVVNQNPSTGHSPIIDLKGNGSDGPLSINTSTELDLSWTVIENADSCIASGDWSGNKDVSGGSENIGTLSEGSYTYDIECGNEHGTTTDSVSVSVSNGGGGGGDDKPDVDLKGNGSDGPLQFDNNTNLDLSWTVNDADVCLALDSWSGNKDVSGGSENIGTLNDGNYTYSLECGNEHGTTTDSVDVIVSSGGGGGGGGGGSSKLRIFNEEVEEVSPGTAFVTWETNKDATRQVFYGTQSVSSPDEDVDNYGYQNSTVYLDDPMMDMHAMAITGLVPGQTYYFRPVSTKGSKTAVGDELVLNPQSTGTCVYLFDFLKIGENNDPIEVLKLQVFLKEIEGFDELEITGVFDQQTFDAVSEFQERYDDDILNPWGYGDNESTGYVYILTKKKVNEIFCQRAFPLTEPQEEEIASYRTFLASLEEEGVLEGEDFGEIPTEEAVEQEGGVIDESLIGAATTSPTLVQERGALGNLAAVALSTLPDNLKDTMICLVTLLLLLALIYVITEILSKGQNYKRQKIGKIMSYIIGILLAIILAFLIQMYCLVFPLFLVLVVLIIIWSIGTCRKKKTDKEVVVMPSLSEMLDSADNNDIEIDDGTNNL